MDTLFTPVLSRTVFRVPEFIKGFLGEMDGYLEDIVCPVTTKHLQHLPTGEEHLSVYLPTLLSVTLRAVAEVTVCDC